MPDCEYCDGAQCLCPKLQFCERSDVTATECQPDAIWQAAEEATEAFRIALLKAARAMPRPPIVFAKRVAT